MPLNFTIEADIAKASSLPSTLYFEPAALALERERIFAATWQFAGRWEQVAKPGDYFTVEVAGEPLLIVRGAGGELRAFYNVCRHRAGPAAEGCGSRKVFRCAYHGWTYGLDGRLLNAPEFEGVENFSFSDFGLRPVPAGEWGQWIFVNLNPQAASLLEELRELPQQSAKFEIEKLQLFERREYVMECNWKAYIDNYLEGYHLPSVHPGLNRELDYGSYETERYERHSVQSSPIRGPENESSDGKQPRRYKSASDKDVAEYYWIFPNWMLNCYPDHVSLNAVIPLSPEKTLAIFEWYFDPALLGGDAARAAVKFSDEIQLEDGHICEVVQRNLRSKSYSRGRYSVKQEKGVHHFHRLYAHFLQSAELTPQKVAGSK